MGDERILVVDDEPEIRKTAARLLRLDGYEVEVAASGIEAVALCEAAEVPFDLLLTDVVMPGMTGGELTGLLRRRSPALRVLYMSGYNEEDVVRHGVLHEDAAFLQKPFTRRDLAFKVREILDG